jgi:GATA-binding protein
MGMGIGMGLGQQAKQQQSQQASSPSQPSSPDVGSLPKGASNPGRTNLVSNILNDDFFSARVPSTPLVSPPITTSFTTSRRPSQSDAASPSFPDVLSPEKMAKKDPLATQVWKAYARAKDVLPNGQRMENLTWRLMHLTLKKPDEQLSPVKEAALQPEEAERERGRSKGKSRVVGFQGQQKENTPEAE